ncbi:MAG: flavin reductase (DIM6/NTAB) family NADH-FMN oxidoreductase RutF [Flavobacteriaceae bacterium]|jgi:flavin reductase (DIM6/NTAB) family NADH-FMN oxidoreductase RutF|tara:strand:+ start:7391 stop:8017 length:627 start_codon:yes stop_codon:yes gene_type:complete
MDNVKSLDPLQLDTKEVHKILLSSVAPRPIAFASTVDLKGNVNLSPFSYFNVFSSNPPILIFSPSRRVRDNTTKHTLENAKETKEVVINVVNYSIVEQMSQTSREYDKGVNEFVETGLTEVPSLKVKPPRVLESPISFECTVDNIVSLGESGGAGQLIIAKVIQIHINKDYLDTEGNIDSEKLELVARMGGDWYTKANKESMFKIPKP